ncbi:MAG TPA: monovalent cation/H+ antiporter complex subunit F [Chloroflexota bacterium]
MNAWLVASLGLLAALVPCGVVVLRAGRFDRLVALQLATVITVLALLSLSIGLERPSYADLAVTLVLLAFPGTLAFAITLERWL